MKALLSNAENFFRIFQSVKAEVFCCDVHVGGQGFYYVGNVLRNVGPFEVEAPGCEVGGVGFYHDPAEGEDGDSVSEGVSSSFVADPAGNADVEAQVQQFPEGFFISGEAVDHGQGADGLVAFEAVQEVFFRISQMEEHGFMQFFGQGDEFFEVVKLVFFFGIHVVIVQACFSHHPDGRIGEDDFTDALKVFFTGRIGAVGMDAGGAQKAVFFCEIVHQFVVFPVGAGKYASDAGCFGIFDDFFRVGKGGGEEVEAYVIVSYVHDSFCSFS